YGAGTPRWSAGGVSRGTPCGPSGSPSMVLADVPPWFLRTFAVAFGLIWGSFINVVIYRVPLRMSVIRPPSHCPGCGRPVAAYDNIPVISYIGLAGRARCCNVRLSPRYPLVELIGGA